jgi:hypothetical protein
MKTYKIYLSGQITGLTESKSKELFLNYQKETLDLCKCYGHNVDVVNPVLIAECLRRLGGNPRYTDYMRADVQNLIFCDVVYRLYNWKDSGGSCIETMIADAVGIPCVDDTESLLDVLKELRKKET